MAARGHPPPTLFGRACAAVARDWKAHVPSLRNLPADCVVGVLSSLVQCASHDGISAVLGDVDLLEPCLGYRDVLVRALQCLFDAPDASSHFSSIEDMLRVHVVALAEPQDEAQGRRLSSLFTWRKKDVPEECPAAVGTRWQDPTLERVRRVTLALSEVYMMLGWDLRARNVLAVWLATMPDDRNEDAPEALVHQLYGGLLRYGKSLDSCCKYENAQAVYERALAMHARHPSLPNPAFLYSLIARLYWTQCKLAEAEQYSNRALVEYEAHEDLLTHRERLFVLRSASRVNISRRRFPEARALLRRAAVHAREWFGPAHPLVGSVLSDCGHYLLNVDQPLAAAWVLREAFAVRAGLLGPRNVRVAAVASDLAYALYVQHYTTGRFDPARHFAEFALDVVNKSASVIVPDLQRSVAMRVLALVLEEIAIDRHPDAAHLLRMAREYQESGLAVCVRLFGEENLNTAKFYGNCGRLYQTLRLYDLSEKMHLRALAIKRKVLGPNDLEVALSAGHLASLYNYDLARYKDAEALYLLSIDISVALYGRAFSGLEFDYGGLVSLYSRTNQAQKHLEYQRKLSEWEMLREGAGAQPGESAADWGIEVHPPSRSEPGGDWDGVPPHRAVDPGDDDDSVLAMVLEANAAEGAVEGLGVAGMHLTVSDDESDSSDESEG